MLFVLSYTKRINKKSSLCEFISKGGNEMYLQKPESLKVLEILYKRMPFNSELVEEYFVVRKGYEGECKFYNLISQKGFPMIVLHDVLIKKIGTAQIDFIVIMATRIYLFEVKNFEGTVHHKGDDFIKNNYKLDRNPLNRAKNGFDILDGILRANHVRIPAEWKLVFINESFTLYGHQPEVPILLLPQLEEFFEKMAKTSAPLTNYHYKIAHLIRNSRPESNLYKSDYKYDYESLEKGIWCDKCESAKMINKHRYLKCSGCSKTEPKIDGVKRSIAEFKLLFPDKILTARILKDWCGNIIGETFSRCVIKEMDGKNNS